VNTMFRDAYEQVLDFVTHPLDYTLLGNDARSWSAALAVGVVALAVLKLIRNRVINRIGAYAQTRQAVVLRFVGLLLAEVKMSLLVAIAVVVGSTMLDVSGAAERALRVIVILAVGWQFLVWTNYALDFGIERLLKKKAGPGGEVDAGLKTTLIPMKIVLQVVLILLLVLVAIQNMGIDVGALLAGVGIGGIAIALATQNILADLFGAFSIVMDKPFVLGDFIVVGEQMGTVEKIGLKTTRLRSISGEQLIFTNTDLLQSRIRNYKRMQERRSTFTFGVQYSTPPDILDTIPGIVKEIIESMPQTRFDRSAFAKFGESSLDFETAYFVLAPEYAVFARTQHAINIALIRRFNAMGVGFAFPTRTLVMDQAGIVGGQAAARVTGGLNAPA